MDLAETPQVVGAYVQAMGYPWRVALAGRDVLQRYNVVSTSIKYGVGRDGIVRFYEGYGVKDLEHWRQVFEDLAAR